MPVSIRRLLLPLTAALALGLPAAGAQAATCPGADAAASDPGAAQTTLCLLNEQRTSRGLPALARSTSLDRASADFAQAMVTHRFFAHVSPGGSTLTSRIRAASWVPSGSWSAAENIAWGSGSLGTPARIVTSWMQSAGHRANILNGTFDEIGIGIAEGAPRGGISGPAGTYVTDFGAGALDDEPPAAKAPSTAAKAPSRAAKPPSTAARCATQSARVRRATTARAKRAARRAARRCITARRGS